MNDSPEAEKSIETQLQEIIERIQARKTTRERSEREVNELLREVGVA